MQQKRDTCKLEEWWHNHFFHKFSHFVILSHVSQFFTSLSYLWPSFFKGSCIFFGIQRSQHGQAKMEKSVTLLDDNLRTIRAGKARQAANHARLQPWGFDCFFQVIFLCFSWFSTRFVEATPQLLESVKADQQLRSWPKVDSCSAWQRQVNAYESQLKLEEVATITVGRPKEKGLKRRLVRGKPPESYSIKANSCCDGKLKPWIKDDERM